MEKYNREFVSCLAELRQIDRITSFQKSDFDSMTKNELFEVFPSRALVSWSKPKVLREIIRVYDSTKQYLAKHGDNLGQLSRGQICLIGTLNTYRDESTVYFLDGIRWEEMDCTVTCRLQELAINISTTKPGLYCRVYNCQYNDNQQIYPVSKIFLNLNSERVNNFTEALKTINRG